MTRPPIPSEHGAWMMLYGPMGIALGGVGVVNFVPTALVVVLVSTAFLGQHAAGLIYRGRSSTGTGFWFGFHVLLFLACSSVLILYYGHSELIWIGLVAALFFSRQVLKVWRSQKRVDHSVFGEIAAVGAMALTGPTAYLVQIGTVDRVAAAIWLVCILYFGASVFYVKMRVRTAASKTDLSPQLRWNLGRDLVFYQLFVIVLIGALAAAQSAFTIVLLGFLPSWIRSFWGWAKLETGSLSLVRIGVGEICYSVWFCAACIAALRTM